MCSRPQYPGSDSRDSVLRRAAAVPDQVHQESGKELDECLGRRAERGAKPDGAGYPENTEAHVRSVVGVLRLDLRGGAGVRGEIFPSWKHTPLTTLVPIRVTKPLTLSDRNDERTRVDPGSCGAKRAAHACRPSFKETSDSWSDCKSHSSS